MEVQAPPRYAAYPPRRHQLSPIAPPRRACGRVPRWRSWLALMGELLRSRHRHEGVPSDRQLHRYAAAPVVVLQAQVQATQGRRLLAFPAHSRMEVPITGRIFGGIAAKWRSATCAGCGAMAINAKFWRDSTRPRPAASSTTRKRRQHEGKNLRTRQQRRVAGCAIALSIELRPNLSPSPAGPGH